MFSPDALPPRIASKIAVDASGCWLWTASIRPDGYGQLNVVIDGKKTVRVAHRIVYMELVGAIDPALQLDHLCRVRHCVNPEHVEQVPQKVNLARGESPTAINGRKEVCPRCDSEYTYTARGYRRCRPCAIRTCREYHWANRDRELAKMKQRREARRARLAGGAS